MRTINGKQYIENAPHNYEELTEIMDILTDKEIGCAWDSAQTHESMKKCLSDECQEVIDAIDNKDDENLCEELGDVLLQVLMHAEVAEARGAFTMEDVIQMLCEKLIRRHPHVFGDYPRPQNEEDALALWYEVKAIEKARKKDQL